MHIFFSRQIQYKMLLLITVHPFALKVVGGQPETFRRKWFFKGTEFPEQPLSICMILRLEFYQRTENYFLFKHPLHVCVLCVWPFLPSSNRAKSLLYFFTAWIFRVRCSWESKLLSGVLVSLVALFLCSVLFCFHAPTYLWKSIFKSKPVFKAASLLIHSSSFRLKLCPRAGSCLTKS